MRVNVVRLPSKMLSFIGKQRQALDERVSLAYVLSEGIAFVGSIIRGRVIGVGLSSGSSFPLVERGVKLRCKNKKLLGNGVRLKERPYIDALSTEGVVIGSHSSIARNSRIECMGTLASIGAGVTIGEGTSFGSDCFFGVVGGIKNGSDVIAGQKIKFHSENHRFDRTDTLIRMQGVIHKGITIGNNCWIGAGAVFLDGVQIGDGCVVAANTVVTKTFPENSIPEGVPAKMIGARS